MSLFDSGIRPAVDKWLLEKSKEERDYGDYWSASQAGYCMRKVIFERLKVPKIEQEGDARKQRVFTSGHIFHQWMQEITKESGLSIAQELELQDEELMIRGHIDDLVLIDGRLMLLDYKTVNSRAFLWAKKNGNAMSYYHKMQLGTYMYMLRNTRVTMPMPTTRKTEYGTKTERLPQLLPTKDLTEARILKIEKDTLMMQEQQLLWTPDLERDVVGYWRTLNGYWKKKTIPKCTCADYENGFLAKEAYNGYFKYGEPCSLKYYQEWKEEQNDNKV